MTMMRLDINILFNMINILILFFLMKRFLFKPINEILERRQAEADEKLAAARETQKSAVKCKEEYEEFMRRADQEGTAIVSRAREEASREYNRIVEEAGKKATGIVDKAVMDAENEKKKILRQAESEVRDLVVEAVSRVAAGKADSDYDSALYDQFLGKNGEV